ncbi:hypothetical protein [Microbulbifer sp. ZKSA002]|uniref:hypothetical protein n=1 Tax=Microbulbifer sp. ZKSA002 TaxID=3243388 RepID=UPI00403901FD
MIKDREVDEFEEDERVRVLRIELSLLVSEVGAYNSEVIITLGGVAYTVRNRLGDGGIVWRVNVYG